MRQHLLRWISPLVILGFLFCENVQAQSNTAPGQEAEHTGEVIFSYVLAVLGTILVLVILGTPTRKPTRD